MAMMLVTSFWVLLGIYSAIGLLFALYLAFFAVGKVDAVAQEGTWGFRLFIIPGLVAFWPLFLLRLIRGVQSPPVEQNAHRQAAIGQKGGES